MRLSDIDLRLLRVFKAVAESGGFVRAQGVLGISQPAISAHIANLEKRLNVRLCNRGAQGFSLTAQGEDVLQETNRLLDHLEAYANRLNEISKKPVPMVRIGVVDCLVTDPANPVPTAIRAVRNNVSSLETRIGVYDYLDCLTELRAGRLDIAVFGIDVDEVVPDDLMSQQIYDETSGLFCAPDHPCAGTHDAQALSELLKSSEIAAHSFLNNPIDDGLALHLLEDSADVSQGNIESTTYLALAGSHVGIIPIHYANQWVTSGRLVQIAPDRYRVISRIHAVSLRDRALGQGAQELWSALVSTERKQAT